MKPPIHLENRELDGQRLVSPSAERNCGPIGEKLRNVIRENAHVLEIASGTGQHGHHMCRLRDDITWQYTDIDAPSRASQLAYAADFPDRMPAPIEVNVTQNGWWGGHETVTDIYCANMIHIAPWMATEGLAQGAGALLKNGGKMYLYGPFLIGSDSAPSNLEFDANLKTRNPDWGVRSLDSVKHIFADHGLILEAKIEMPRNNSLLIFDSGS